MRTVVLRTLSSRLTPVINSREYPHKVYIARNYSHCTTSLPLIVWVYFHSNFCVGLRKSVYFETECKMAVQGRRFWYQSKACMQLPISRQ